MPYGLDYSDVRYETDHAGNRLKATIPYTMFSALTEFWIAARRAQTAQLEASTRPGLFKGSLQAAQVPTPDDPPTVSPRRDSARPLNLNDRHWQSLIARLPEEVEPQAKLETPAAISPPEAFPPDTLSTSLVDSSPKPKRRVFYRAFVEAPPTEVVDRVANGMYFIRAWREHRGLTVEDAADLLGRDKTTVAWHESGKATPSRLTLEKLAQVYDCPVAQLTPLPGSDDSAFDEKPVQAAPVIAEVKPEQRRRTIKEPRSPAATDYPDAVLAYMVAGKSPMLAWRLYRNMTVKALAEAYATTSSNVKSMEQHAWLRRSTIAKLWPVFHCKPEQLLRPEGMPSLRGTLQTEAKIVISEPARVNKAVDRHSEQPASVMEAAFLQAGVVEPTVLREVKERDRARIERLAKMQAELERL
ncbi:hypothetical protein R8871_02572 [Paraburkholderia graminis C4D1M]|uniref:Transcriptional regulator, XRE family n=1 Tax=Paraburkholderia graminis (strain ATCC 700544 / DSM 17151 / LMG 18924 / NCIMB 13744 / C4D1M) TaxID=396598 RepID=B1G963_PARG4|nr:helix-turn-helix domain-containing protein [Paraburkholderia graminis]EDT07324.1 transcriptional regulator, XRE family [Paraburkholderia graminis C4D1M]CAB3682158.1 hypothetical protein R8871_02572 [Paraburkholderia graminis C4D1M]